MKSDAFSLNPDAFPRGMEALKDHKSPIGYDGDTQGFFKQFNLHWGPDVNHL